MVHNVSVMDMPKEPSKNTSFPKEDSSNAPRGQLNQTISKTSMFTPRKAEKCSEAIPNLKLRAPGQLIGRFREEDLPILLVSGDRRIWIAGKNVECPAEKHYS